MAKLNNKTLLVIAGPTAVGKTQLCVYLAKQLNCDIISFDSRQFYKELFIGTAKPSPEEQEGVKHHFIDSHSIFDELSSGDFALQAEKCLNDIFENSDIAITTGGSGLYLQAWLEGLDDMPEVPADFRIGLMKRLELEGLATLQEELRKLDPEYFAIVDYKNPVRVVRALEVIYATGKPFSFYRTGKKKELPFRVIKIMLDRPKEELYERINKRMDLMLAAGLEEEARQFYPYRNLYALRTVGYNEVFDFMDGKISKEEMIDKLKQNSRNYAKRQVTWFKKDSTFHWFHPNQQAEILTFIKSQIE